MAITNARMQIKRGNEVDFDAEKMLVGEWALSTDKRIVRICVAPNVCIRMATYDAFEVDMAQIEKILEECRTIEDVVKLINSQVSEKLELTIEYTNQAKQYRDETEQFRNEVESMVDIGIATTEKAGVVKPDGTTIRVDEDGTIHADNGTVDYNELENKPSINGMELSGDKSLDELGIASVEALEETNYKVDTILEKAGLTLKNTASGSPIHLTDSANGKNVGFGLYGKAEQKQYSGKNLLQNTAESKTINGVTFTVNNEDGSITANGTSSGWASIRINATLEAGTYILSGCPSDGGVGKYVIYISSSSLGTQYTDYGKGTLFTVSEAKTFPIEIVVYEGVTVNNIVFKPMIRLASITDDTYEPYVGGIPSPNPDYPQEITVAGESGSVEVVSCGKNLLKNLASSHVYNGITFTVNDDGSVTANGTSTGDIWVNLTGANSVKLDLDGNYILSGCPIGGSVSKYALTAVDRGTDDAKDVSVYRDEGKGVNVLFDSTHYYKIFIRVYSGATLNNLTYYPMIRLASDTDSTYQPYTETTSTIPTPNGLCGIKVSSGGNYVDENGQQWLCDEVVKYADGSGKRIQRIGKAVFDGSEDEAWNYNNQYFYSDVISSQNANEKNNFMCNRFNVVDVNTSIMVRDNTIGLRTNFVAINYAEITNISDFKTWLASNNTIVLYELKEPIITDLSAEEIAEIEKLHTFYPVTNISNDADCGMSITYMADAKNYIDNRLALIESAMLNNI